MGDAQMRKNVRHATDVIQVKRARVVGEMPDWQDLREAGRQIRQHTMENLDFYLESLRGTALGRVESYIGLGMLRRLGGLWSS